MNNIWTTYKGPFDKANHEYQPFSIQKLTISTQTRKHMQKYNDIWRFIVEVLNNENHEDKLY